MSCKCSLPISSQVWLIDQPKSSASIFYFGGTRPSSSEFIENINLHMVSESQPEKHLHTLLTKGMLVEAEVIFSGMNFILFKLSASVVHIIKFRFFLGIGQKVQFESATNL